jgi:hypothetical protein
MPTLPLSMPLLFVVLLSTPTTATVVSTHDMFQHSIFSSAKERKKQLLAELESHSRKIEQYDRAHLAASSSSSAITSVTDNNEQLQEDSKIDDIYQQMHAELQQVWHLYQHQSQWRALISSSIT